MSRHTMAAIGWLSALVVAVCYGLWWVGDNNDDLNYCVFGGRMYSAQECSPTEKIIKGKRMHECRYGRRIWLDSDWTMTINEATK